jgi:predicted GNAT family N-acyltransferase
MSQRRKVTLGPSALAGDKAADALELAEIEHGSRRYSDLVDLRRRMLRAPLGLDFSADQLAAERDDIHIAAYVRGQLVGCVSLAATDTAPCPTAKLRQMAVDPNHQGRGVGAKIVAFAEKLARARAYEEIVLHARDSALPFYEKAGFVAIGEVFVELGIPHRKMLKRVGGSAGGPV